MKEIKTILDAVRRRPGPMALATVVRVTGSAYRRPGARMLLGPEGWLAGSVSGGCLEGDVLQRALKVMADNVPALVTYDTRHDSDIIFGVGLGCSGVVQILIEPLKGEESLTIRALRLCLETRRPVVLASVVDPSAPVPLASHLFLGPDGHPEENIPDRVLRASLAAAAREALAGGPLGPGIHQSLSGPVQIVLELIQPPPALYLFGAGHDAVPLARLAGDIGWHVTVVDSRPAYANHVRFPTADEVIVCRPEAVAAAIKPEPGGAAVLMSHHYQSDLALLPGLLLSPLSYVGVLGPRLRTNRMLEDLDLAGAAVTREQHLRLYAPAGLDIGAEAPEEVALAILSEIRSVMARRSGSSLREKDIPIHDHPSAATGSADLRVVLEQTAGVR